MASSGVDDWVPGHRHARPERDGRQLNGRRTAHYRLALTRCRRVEARIPAGAEAESAALASLRTRRLRLEADTRLLIPYSSVHPLKTNKLIDFAGPPGCPSSTSGSPPTITGLLPGAGRTRRLQKVTANGPTACTSPSSSGRNCYLIVSLEPLAAVLRAEMRALSKSKAPSSIRAPRPSSM